VRHVKKVLDTFQREILYVTLSKCEFGKTALVYLGHIVGGGQLKIDPSKIDVIVNWPEPKSVINIQSFLGAIQYWRRFISNFKFSCSYLMLMSLHYQAFPSLMVHFNLCSFNTILYKSLR
jgi:hypothetical protein